MSFPDAPSVIHLTRKAVPTFFGYCTALAIPASASADPSIYRATWSQYKHYHTGKFFALVLGGDVVYVSDGYEGSISDDEIIRVCDFKFMPQLPFGSHVVAGPGFPHTERPSSGARVRGLNSSLQRPQHSANGR